MEHNIEKSRGTTSGDIVDIQSQINQLQKSLRDVEESLKKSSGNRGFWVERFMYWAIVIGLIIAVIMVG